MTLSITHTFVSGKADGVDPTLIQPSYWNAALSTSMATGKILGRTTASTGVIEELPITGTGNVVMSASPTLSGTVAVGSGNVQFGDSSNRITRGEFLTTDFGYRTSYSLNEIRTNWPSFTGVTNDSDENLKVQLGDLLDYWGAAKEVAAQNIISDFEIYRTPEKTGTKQGGFGVKSAQKMFEIFGGLGIRQPDEPHTQAELDAYAADQKLPEEERTVVLRRVNEYWGANADPFALLGLKIASMAAVKIDNLQTQVDLLEARLAALEAK